MKSPHGFPQKAASADTTMEGRELNGLTIDVNCIGSDAYPAARAASFILPWIDLR
jgi:hypothetical protein